MAKSSGSLISRVTKGGICTFLVFFVILYNEWLAYALRASSWTVIPKSPEDKVVLFAADPQILTEEINSNFPYGFITTWDSDRFVQRGLQFAIWKTRPDVVVFLGDLLDQGSKSTDDEFFSLAKHFKNVMRIPDYVKEIIFVPGDNDIGGEGSDSVTKHKIQRFFNAFNQSTVTSLDFINFKQVNAMDDSELSKDLLIQDTDKDDGKIKVILSHMPLLPLTSRTIKEKIIKRNPDMIFSAHEHSSFHFVGLKKDGRANQFGQLKEEDKVWMFNTQEEKLNEIVVPTCSYRMGKSAYGFGSAVIEKTGRIHYTVLWLPSRFYQLGVYCFISFVVFLLMLPSMFVIIVKFIYAHVRKYHHL
ncbi:unnamed protein product [Meganyctiphanes norvegica]|uniref:Calcineurin-like phosphoesterase domain-containing protein n=1 Tax=Meganyctiphanes norvegica TaxID=48144 RepID=A0AAV2QB38_MEGNR